MLPPVVQNIKDAPKKYEAAPYKENPGPAQIYYDFLGGKNRHDNNSTIIGELLS